METTRTTTFLSHTKRLRTVMAAAVVSLGILVSGSAWAGKVSHQDVIVNVWTAYGTTYGARHAPSDGKFLPEQYIGCSLLAGIAGGGTPSQTWCAAKGNNGKTLTCYSYDARLRAVVSAMSDHGYIRFDVNSLGECDVIEWKGGSQYLP